MESQSHTLPTNYSPQHYEIELSDLDLDRNQFVGTVRIHLKTNDASRYISLNTRDINIVHARVELKDGEFVDMIDSTSDPENDVIRLDFGTCIKQEIFELCIQYTGQIQTNMSGFYRSDYTDFTNGAPNVMLSTQFEATDARRAFPCFDEPALKATFDVSIVADERFTVLSNMPLKNSKNLRESKSTMYRFHTTPLMSTYLVAWAVGEFDHIESETEKSIYPTTNGYNTLVETSMNTSKLPIRVYTAKGKANQGRFALEMATKVIDFFSESFEIPYPLPKLDLLCVESYSHNAMENFSLITFRPSALLYDGDLSTADVSALQKIAYVVSHEIAHQWFGNLVTMRWWDELWLNEGFATWVGYLAVEKFYPSWDVPSMIMLKSHEVALELDSLKESHPIKVAVRNAKDIDQVFDSISYLKGCSILEMLSGYIGQDVFLKGVALYLQRNKFSNASMHDLFNCIGEVSGVEILKRTEDWILKIGYPLITISETKDGQISVSQNRFLSTGRPLCDDNKTIWWVPLMPSEGSSNIELWEKNKLIGKSKFNHFNDNAFGFYRVKYNSEHLFEEILGNLPKLSSRSKMALISDVEVTGSIKQLLKLLSNFGKSHDPNEFYVWCIIFETIKKMKSLLSNDKKISKELNKFTLALIEPSINSISDYLETPKFDSSNNFLKRQFYELLTITAGSSYHPQVVAKCNSLFESKKYPDSIRNTLLRVILCQPDTTKETITIVLSELKSATLTHKEVILAALGSVQNPELFETVLHLLLTIEPMDVQFLADSLGANNTVRYRLWTFIKENYTELHKRLSINNVVIDRFLKFSLKDLTGDDIREDFDSFFIDKNLEGFDRGVRQTSERIEKNTKYVKTNLPLVKEYFEL